MHFACLQTAVVCYGAVVAMETTQVAVNPSQAFQFAIKRRCILWKIVHNGPILMKLCQPVLGVRFFLKHNVLPPVCQTTCGNNSTRSDSAPDRWLWS